MNYIYGEPRLNIKKVIIALIILVILIILGIIFIFSSKKDSTPFILEKDKTFLIDNSFNITFDKSLKLEQTESVNNFLLELHSKSNLNFYISKIEGFENEDFLKIAKSDYYYYPKNFENAVEISELTECIINNFPGYSYNFKYVDSATTYYLQIYILKINNSIYTFNIEFPLESINAMLPNIDLILNTIELSA